MANEYRDEPVYIDPTDDARQHYLETIDDAIKVLDPNMPSDRINGNQRLYMVYERVFNALGYTPPQGGTLVELGIGSAPYLVAIQEAFHPKEHIGIDLIPADVVANAIQSHYPDLPEQGPGSVRVVTADATDPSTIPGFENERKVDVVLALHPDLADVEDQSESDADFIVNPTMLQQMDNWRQRLSEDGVMIVTTYFPEEAEALVSDPQLNPYVALYGPTDAISQAASAAHCYVVVLRPTPRAEEAEPVVWQLKDYEGYDEGSGIIPDMFQAQDD